MLDPNPHIAAMSPYKLADLKVPAGVEPIGLAQNEHIYAPCPSAVAAATDALHRGNLYPDPDWSELRAAISELHALDPDRIVCGAGSMELIAALGTSYLNRDSSVVLSQYGYAFARTVANLMDANVEIAPEPNYRVDVDAVLASVTESTRFVFIANPGNPTGTYIASDELRALRDRLPSRVLLIIDEAYAEFVEHPGCAPLFDLVERENTVVLRTFSKVYGLAGMRVGWGYCPESIVENLRKVLIPSSVSSAAQRAAVAALRDQASMQAARSEINVRREWLTAELRTLGLTIPDSHTNFVLIEFSSDSDAHSAFEALRCEGILLRGMSGYGLAHCLRATVGTQSQTEATVAAIARWIEAR